MGRVRPKYMGWAEPGPNAWAGPNLAQMHGLVTVHIVTGVTVCIVTRELIWFTVHTVTRELISELLCKAQ